MNRSIRSIQSTSSVSKLTDTSLEKRKDAENINSVIKNNNINITMSLIRDFNDNF